MSECHANHSSAANWTKFAVRLRAKNAEIWRSTYTEDTVCWVVVPWSILTNLSEVKELCTSATL